MKKLLFGLFVTLNLFAGDPPGTHGMLVFGNEKLYISHLPMFHVPHNYQWIAEIKIPDSLKTQYLNLKSENPGVIFTLEPERFVLPEMQANPKPFKAVLYHGHFEKDGVPMGGQVVVNIVKTVFFKKFDSMSVKPMNYPAIVFGDASGLFVAHEIFSAPDFDQVSEVTNNLELVNLIKASKNSLDTAGLLNKNQIYLESRELER